jgi:hypothetical protein
MYLSRDVRSPGTLFEHVVIEGDPAFIPPLHPHDPGRALRTYALESRFHGYVTELAIRDGHYLSARCVRPRGRSCDYGFDLRFADPTPIRVYRTSWRWLALAAGSGLSVYAAMQIGPAMDGGIAGLHLLIAVPAAAAGLMALLAAARRTTESLELRSAHGRARLVGLVGGIGRARSARGFLIELARHIEAARLARSQDRRQFLCAELREHRRLYELGVLSDDEYAASKASILAAHEHPYVDTAPGNPTSDSGMGP